MDSLMDQDRPSVSAEFPFESRFVDVLGTKIHYVEQGEGDPILFLHGVPTSSYLWRNVIPYLSDYGRCIAVDLVGMGKSEKPDIEYRVFDHIQYIDAFIDSLKLNNITLVVHGWGSVIGFDIAMRHPSKIKGVAFLESHIRPVRDWTMVALPVHELSQVLHLPDGGYDIIMNSQYFVNKVLPAGVLRKLSDEELSCYRAPFANPGSCLPLWQYLQDLPLGQGPSDVVQLITSYSEQLQASTVPKLMMYAVPGFITTMATVEWAKANLPELTLVDLGEALHYAQESNPEAIGQAIRAWYKDLPT